MISHQAALAVAVLVVATLGSAFVLSRWLRDTSGDEPTKAEFSAAESGAIITQLALDALGRHERITVEQALAACEEGNHPSNPRHADIHMRGLARSLPFIRPALPEAASDGLPPDSDIKATMSKPAPAGNKPGPPPIPRMNGTRTRGLRSV